MDSVFGDEAPTFVKNYEKRKDLPNVMELPTVVDEETATELDFNSLDADELEIIPDEDVLEDEDSFEDETSDEWQSAWDRYTKFCYEQDKHPLACVSEHISDVNSDVYAALMFLVRRLTVEEIMEIEKKVVDQCKYKEAPIAKSLENDKPAATQLNAPNSTKGEPESESALIHLRKGLDLNHIKEFIVRIDAQFQKKQFESVNVITNDWDSSGEFFALIPAAKKLFAKYSEAGLMGCLLSHNYQEAAKRLYCISYVKGKKNGNDDIIFAGIDQHDYRVKAKASVAEYASILKSVGVARTKKAPLEFLR